MDDISTEYWNDLPEEFPELWQSPGNLEFPQIRKQFTDKLPKVFSKEFPDELYNEFPEELLEESSQKFPQELPKDLPEDFPKDFLEGSSKEYSDDLPEEFLEELPDSWKPEIRLDNPSGIISVILSGILLRSAPEIFQSILPGIQGVIRGAP